MMHFKRYTWLAFLWLSTTLLQGQEHWLTLKSQFTQNNASIQLAQSKVDYARLEYQKSKRDYLPKIELQAQYFLRYGGRSLLIPTGDLINPIHHNLNYLNTLNFPSEGTQLYPQAHSDVANTSIRFMRLREYDTNLSLTLPLLNPSIGHNVQLKKMQLELATLQLKQTMVQEWSTFRMKYYQYLQSKMTLELLELSQQKIQAQRQQMQKQLEAHQLLAYMLEAVVLDEESLALAMRKQRLQVSEEKRQLEVALQSPLPKVLATISEKASDYLLPYTVAQLMDLWQKNNSQIQLIQKESKLLQQELTVKKESHQPNLNLILSSGLQGENLRFNEAPFYAVSALQLKWNLFNPKRNLEKEQKRLLAGQNLLQNKALIQKADQQLRRLHQALLLATDQLHLKNKQLDFAKQQLKRIESEYREGKRSHYDIHLEQLKVKDAKLDYLDARFDFLVSLCKLEQLLGTSLSHSF
ncbi:MAG: TolC family protein [Bacteroidota bacterium]